MVHPLIAPPSGTIPQKVSEISRTPILQASALTPCALRFRLRILKCNRAGRISTYANGESYDLPGTDRVHEFGVVAL
jgi:hypothetical protein